MDSPHDDPDRAAVRGAVPAADALVKRLSTWDAYRYELTELIEVDDHVLQLGRKIVTARGAEVASEVHFVRTFCNQRAVRMRMFYRRHEALKAVGLEE